MNMADVIDGLIEKGTRMNDGDYVKDGFLHCGTCNAPKQMRLDILGKERIVPIICDCEKKEMADEAERERLNKQKQKIDRLREIGIVDKTYLKWRQDMDDGTNKTVSRLVKNYITNWEIMKRDNVGLLLYGGVGTGKTWAAAAIANFVLDSGEQALMTNVPALISSMSRDFGADKNKVMGLIANASLLVIDDFGIERDTEYAYEKLQEIIDARYRSGKPLIVTTNLTPSTLKDPEDTRYKRVYDRILEMCKPVAVTGESRRAAIAAKKREEATKLLGV